MKTKNSYPNYYFTHDNKRIFYITNFEPTEENSTRPLLVLNYGLLCNFDHWSKQVPYFDDLGFNLLLHDYRGHFSSSGAEDISSITFNNMVKDLSGILTHLNSKNIVMIGHSMGVNITIEYARLYPDYLKGLILISGTVFTPHEVMFDTNIISFV